MKTKLEKQQLQRLAEKEEELKVNFASKISEFEDAKRFELEEVKEKVRKKSKMEIETLRSRFKMMQATGTMERSPSVSESEFTMEVSMEDYDETDDYNFNLLLYKAPKRYRSFSSSDYRNDLKVGSKCCLFLACFDSGCLLFAPY